MNTEQRNREIDESMKIGVRAFAVGATLILVLAITGVPPSGMVAAADPGRMGGAFAADASTGATADAVVPVAPNAIDSRVVSR